MNMTKPISLLSRLNGSPPPQGECSSGVILPFFVRPTPIPQAHVAHLRHVVRYNALSRALEAALQRESVPNRVLSGVKFFERLEVKDLLAYLQVVDNPDYEPAFVRVINVPKRQIGEKVRSIAFVDPWKQGTHKTLEPQGNHRCCAEKANLSHGFGGEDRSWSHSRYSTICQIESPELRQGHQLSERVCQQGQSLLLEGK
jgi:UvrD-like helicase C-terminal domain